MVKLHGIVIGGKKKGKGLGFPTANIKLQEAMKSGVYAGKVFWDNKEYKAAIFIGYGGKLLEAYLLDFSGDLYGQEIQVEIGKKIREVQKFNNDEELKKQIAKDISVIRNLK